MQKITKVIKGIYLLEIRASSDFTINHKKFVSTSFSKGWYYYVGSAQKNLDKRILRHIQITKKIFWHIDYLTTNKFTSIKRIFLFDKKPKSFESALVSKIYRDYDLTFPAIGFGNSDDKKTKSHLLFSNKRIDQNHFCSLYQATVLRIPSSI